MDKKVWTTSQRSAGLKVRFATTAADVWIYWKNAGSPIGDWLWNFDAHSGVDMYIEDEGLPGARLRWAISSGDNDNNGIN